MTKKQHRALIIGLSYGLNKTCKDLHHSKSERHDYTQRCPAEARYELEMKAAYDALLSNKNKTQYDDTRNN